MSKQTATEWLHEIAKQREPDKFDWQQAKAMHKQEIINAYRDGRSDQQSEKPSRFYNRWAELYYYETYGGNK
jgi:hypothetical protein